jgi:hypothetical protein
VAQSFAILPASSVTGEFAMRILSRFCAALWIAAVCSAQSPSQAQTFWFCPIIPATWNNFIGSVDYLDLFDPGAPWTAASSRIQIFKMYTQMIVSSVPGSFSDGTLQQIFAYLNSHHIALAVEFGPLTPSAPPGCGMGVEGFGGETPRSRSLPASSSWAAISNTLHLTSPSPSEAFMAVPTPAIGPRSKLRPTPFKISPRSELFFLM